jgi:putative nucleotidyltransferase with HDIG domain
LVYSFIVHIYSKGGSELAAFPMVKASLPAAILAINMQKIPVHLLKPGMEIAREVLNHRGSVLIKKGVKIKRQYIERLIKLKIPAVYIVNNLIPDVEIEDIIAEETRLEAQYHVRNILENVEKQPAKKSSNLLFMQKQLTKTLEDIIEQLMKNKNLMVNLADIRTADNCTFSHCVNVAVLSITTGLSMGYRYTDLKKLGYGALLHDLGKIKIPTNILNKPGRLNNEEFEEIKKHPQTGYEIARERDLLDTSSALVIQQHHERINGKGYPNGLKEEEIHKYSKITALVDVYDSLVADRPYRAALQPCEALEIIETNENEFDHDVLIAFVKHIAVYPIGTIVGLSNGLIGVVVYNTVGFPTRPKVRVFCDKEYCQTNIYEIDLMDVLNIVVEKVFTENEIPKHFFKKPLLGTLCC